MARDDVFQVRHSAWPAVGESGAERAVINRLGAQVVVDFFSQLILGGWAYHMQLGTEDAPINSTTAIDDQLVWGVIDNNAGYAAIPLGCQITIANWSTATLFNSMLEWDKDLKRYSSGGTAFTLANLRGDDANSFNGAAYVGTDVTVIAKSAVPNSVEFFRGQVVEDAQATPDAAAASIALQYSARLHPFVVMVDASSFLIHHGTTTADCSSYGNAQIGQLSKALITP